MSRPDSLRVLQVVQSLNVGGLETVVIAMCRKLVELGVKTDICCVEEPGELADGLADQAIDVFSLAKGSGIRLRTVGELKRQIAQRNYQVVHSHSPMGHFYGALAAKWCGVPMMHSRHQMSRTESWRQRMRSRLCVALTQRMVGVSGAVTDCTISDYSLPASRVRTIYNGINTADFSDIKIPTELKVIGTLGRLAPVKNQMSLMKVFARLLKRHPGLRLRIVGSGESQGELEQFATREGLTDSVFFAGYQSNIPEQMSLIDIFVMTSLSEGMPIVLIEAMSAARPVVVTSVGGIPEMLENKKTGLMVDRCNDDALEAAISHLIENPDKAADLARNARVHAVKNFDITQMAENYIVQYLDLARLT